MSAPSAWIVPLPDLAATDRLGDALALLLRPGTLITLSGDLGTGKTTLARAILRAFSNRPGLEVPSPTFTLVQPYDGEGFRCPVLHADLYRVRGASEIEELGLDEALETGAVLVEWPERAGERLPAARFDVALTLDGETRTARVGGTDEASDLRVARARVLREFLDASPFAAARRRFLQGDASPRAYETLTLADGTTRVLLNARASPERPVTPHRRAYMAATHLAPNEDVAPIIAIASEFDRAGFSVPRVEAAEVAEGILVVEDFGATYVAERGRAIEARYEVAVDVLAAMHARPWPTTAQAPSGVRWDLPRYSMEALRIEADVALQYFLPALTGGPTEAPARTGFENAWRGPFALLDAAPRTWTIFDYHSPNLHWLAARDGLRRIGIIDFQDARLGPAAYDVVSLTQDARVDVAIEMERRLLARYVAAARARADFDEDAFATHYAICGAQRATRILGVFARLANEDGKPHYLRHVPRISDYLDRCLTHPALEAVAAWFARYAPAEARARFAAGA